MKKGLDDLLIYKAVSPRVIRGGTDPNDPPPMPPPDLTLPSVAGTVGAEDTND